MNYQRLTKIGILAIGLAIFTACGSQPNNKKNQGNGEHRGGKMPTATELMSEMDTNKDAKLSESEVKGPLQNDFSKIDTNSDGFLDIDELKNAPKPQGAPKDQKPQN
ncbi:hypothetical protein [Labilibaculum sp.]|uniref:hypothetical protein n=1 Tax=Labilibaculum sp. TaxID=2060723 RepID=UPI003564545A